MVVMRHHRDKWTLVAMRSTRVEPLGRLVYDTCIMRWGSRLFRLAPCAIAPVLLALFAANVLAQEGGAPKDAKTQAAPGQHVAPDRSSPRAVVKSFLLAVQDSASGKPERIQDAIACLDYSKLDAEDKAAAARNLAPRLTSVLDKLGVKIDSLPTDTVELVDTIYRAKDDKGNPILVKGKPVVVEVDLDPGTGQWIFSADTLASLPELEEIVAAKDKAEEKPQVATEVPAARRSARATMMSFLVAMDAKQQNLAEAIKCLDPLHRDPESWQTEARGLAFKLKNVIDKIDIVVDIQLPDDPNGDPFTWHSSPVGNIVLARVDDVSGYPKDWPYAPKLGEWRFAPETVAAIDKLYKSLENKEISEAVRRSGVEEQLTFGLWLERQIPDSLRHEFLSLALWKWCALALLVLLGWPIKVIVAALVSVVFSAFLKRRQIHIDPDVRRRAFRSTGWAGTALIWWYVIASDVLVLGDWLSIVLRIAKLVCIVTVVWVSYRVVDVLGGYIAANRDVRLTQFDDVLIPLLTKILRFVVVAVTILFILDAMGQKPATVLGVLGIGGVALAFASQDTIGNFFGSITVLFDRPFGIGDWIVVGDIEGTVERVGFRSTRVRTFYNSVVTIPNSKMVNTNVDNFGARRYRRVKVTLSITYDTPPEKIDAFCEGVRELIRLHPYTRKDYYHVYFNQFASSSLDILLYAFFEVPDWGTELRERHRLFADIVRLARRLGVEFAFPTQTVWLERAAKIAAGESPELQDTTVAEQHGIKQAAQLYTEVYGEEPPHPKPVIIPTTPRSKNEDV